MVRQRMNVGSEHQHCQLRHQGSVEVVRQTSGKGNCGTDSKGTKLAVHIAVFTGQV